MKYHYSLKEDWLGNPCGLVYFGGVYHLFYLFCPGSPRFGPLSWGHATSDDLISWNECPVVISPESELSCNSGSAIVHDGKIRIFYTSLSTEHQEKICCAYSEDGVNFRRVITGVVAPFESDYKFRDPFVFKYGDGFRMLVGSGHEGIAKVLQYESDDLTCWRYMGEILSDGRFGSVIEAPQLVEVDGKWIFIIQSEKHLPTKVLFATGDYNGSDFVFDGDHIFMPVDSGNDFFNPVTCSGEDGQKIIMAWIFSQKMNASVISCPRVIAVSRKGEVCLLPFGDLGRRTVKESNFVSYENGRLRVQFEGRTMFEKAYKECPEIKVLEDIGMVEVFLNGGTEMISVHVC